MSPDSKAALRRLLTDQPRLRLALLFGSLAGDRSGPHSDVDIAVDFGRPIGAEHKRELIERIALQTGRAVDLIDLRRAGEPLLGVILREGERLVGTDSGQAEWLYRQLVEAADFGPIQQRMLTERRVTWIGR
jgi:uncharacterized protein